MTTYQNKMEDRGSMSGSELEGANLDVSSGEGHEEDALKGVGRSIPRVDPAESRSRLLSRIEAITDQKRRDRLLVRAKQVPSARFPSWAKSVLGIASPRAAIKARCEDCVGYEQLPESIRSCTAVACPTWAYRPHQK